MTDLRSEVVHHSKSNLCLWLRAHRLIYSEHVLVLLLLVVSLAFRTYQLTQVPPGLQHDEAFNSHDAVLVLQGVRPVFFEANYGREAFFIYLMAGFIALLGHNVLAIRLTAVTCGLVGQVLLYLLVRRLFGRQTAIIALALSAISFWHIFDSRIGLRAISLPMLLTLSLYLLWLGISNHQLLHWLLSGIAMGLTMYTYLAARIAPLVPLIFFLYLVLSRRKEMKEQWRFFILWIIATLIIFAPFGVYMMHHPRASFARIQELRYPLDQLCAGNPQPVLSASLRTLGMAFIGDLEWRYNLPGLPVFDPVAGIFFYLGLFLCMYHWKEPQRMLLVIWMYVMLLPSMLSGGAPSFLRAIGALPPIMVMPAIGFSAFFEYLGQKKRGKLRGLVYAGFVIWFIFSGANTYRNYFLLWAHAAEPRRIYEADMAEVARYLNLLTDDPLVCISTDFAYDLDRYVLAPQLSRSHRMKWFDGRYSFILPAPSQESEILYIFTASAPLPLFIAERYFAGMEPIYQPLDPRGIPIITVYRHSPDSLARLRQLEPLFPLDVRVGEDIVLLGYTQPVEARQGDVIQTVLYWQVLHEFTQDFSTAPSFIVHLRDADRHLWTQGDRGTGYPAWDWGSGDIALTWFDLPSTGDWPLQRYWVHVGMWASGKRLPMFTDSGQSIDDELCLSTPVQLLATPMSVSESTLPIRTLKSCNFGEQIALRGYTLDNEVKPGQSVTLVLFWQALKKPADDYSVCIRVIDASGCIRYEKNDPLWPGVYPTSQWYAGGFVRSYHTFTLPPDVDSGIFVLGVGLTDAQGRLVANSPCMEFLSELRVKGRKRIWEVPKEIQHPLRAELGDNILFLGYSLQSAEIKAGDVLRLTLYWQARDRISASYKVFTHVLGPNNSIVGQKDSLPCNEECPTTGWLQGEIIVDRYEIPIGPSISAGKYLLEVGMYDPVTLERLPVTVDGKEETERRILLGEVMVRKD